MKNIFEELVEILKADESYFDNGILNKNKIVEQAFAVDSNLIKLLLNNDKIKKHFFINVDGTMVFDKVKFQQVVNNKQFLPGSYTVFKNKIGLSINNNDLLSARGDISLVFPHKDCVLEGGQTKEEQKRNEVFYNEILAPDEIDTLLAPKVFTNFKKFDKDGEHKIDSIDIEKDNLIIKGNNLLAMSSLLERYRGKVKCIYIDPPYNTGSDSFGYNDKFNHASWLVFMKNRLEMAKEFLRNDGVIFVQCDDFEQEYLKILLNEVFKAENHQSTLYIQVRYSEKQLATAMKFHKLIEHIFMFSKTENALIYQETNNEYDLSKYVYEIKENEKPFKTLNLGNKIVECFMPNQYVIIKNKVCSEKLLKEIWASGKILDSSSTGRFFRDYLTGRYHDDGYGVLYKVYGIGSGLGYRYITGPKRQGATKGRYYQEVPTNKIGDNYEGDQIAIPNYYDMAANFGNCRHEGGVELRSGKKPEELIAKVMKLTTKEGDLVMDFHLGSGTTAAVAHKMGRRYIGIEQLDYGENDSVVRLKNVINGDTTGISKEVGWQGGGDFVYCKLKELNQKYVDVIQSATNDNDLVQLWNIIKDNAFLSYKIDIKQINEHITDFKLLSIEDKKQFLMEVLDKNLLYVNYSDMLDEEMNVSEEDKKINASFYEV